MLLDVYIEAQYIVLILITASSIIGITIFKLNFFIIKPPHYILYQKDENIIDKIHKIYKRRI